MTDEQTAMPRYWVLLGTPKGPWTRAELGGQLAAGVITPETPACPVGSDQWSPCSNFLVIDASNPVPSGYPSPPEGVPGDVTAPPPATGLRRRRPASPSRFVIGFALAGGLALLYGAYEWLRPPTAMEVCRRFEKAETVADAKTLVTPRMLRVIEQIYADKTPDDPNDRFELTRETDGPDSTIKHVGLRGSWYIPEEGRRARVEGYLRVVRSDGWKIDDLVFTGIEGVSLPRSFSLVDEFRKAAPSKSGTTPVTSGSKEPSKPSSRNRTLAWLEERTTIEILGLLGLAVMAWVANERFKR